MGRAPRPSTCLHQQFLVGSSWPGHQQPGLPLPLTSHLFSSCPPAGVISEEGLREEVPPLLQHHILKVALELPASKFLWLKAQVRGRNPALRPEFPCRLGGCLGISSWIRTRTASSRGGHPRFSS